VDVPPYLVRHVPKPGRGNPENEMPEGLVPEQAACSQDVQVGKAERTGDRPGAGLHLLDDAPAQHLPSVLHDRRAHFLAPSALLVRRRALAAAALLAVAAAVMVLPAAPVLARAFAAAVTDVHVEGQPPKTGDHQQRQRNVEEQPAAGLCGPRTAQQSTNAGRGLRANWQRGDGGRASNRDYLRCACSCRAARATGVGIDSCWVREQDARVSAHAMMATRTASFVSRCTVMSRTNPTPGGPPGGGFEACPASAAIGVAMQVTKSWSCTGHDLLCHCACNQGPKFDLRHIGLFGSSEALDRSIWSSQTLLVARCSYDLKAANRTTFARSAQTSIAK